MVPPSLPIQGVSRPANDNELYDDNHRHQQELALQLVIANGYLCWNDGNHLGMANKSYYQFWSAHHKEHHPDLTLILNLLERSNSTNLCLRCQRPYCPTSVAECTCHSTQLPLLAEEGDDDDEERYFQRYDPRARWDYDELSTFEKCKRMSFYYKWLVQNLHHSMYNDFRYLLTNDDDDLSLSTPPSPPRRQIQLMEYLMDSHLFEVPVAVDQMRRTTPRRFAFAWHLVTLAVAQEQLCTKGEYPLSEYFSLAFCGGSSSSSIMEHHDFVNMELLVDASNIAEQLFQNLEALAPATDKDLEHYFRTYCYAHDWLSDDEANRIGWIAMNFSIFRPFFSMCPPDGQALFVPINLERPVKDHRVQPKPFIT